MWNFNSTTYHVIVIHNMMHKIECNNLEYYRTKMNEILAKSVHYHAKLGEKLRNMSGTLFTHFNTSSPRYREGDCCKAPYTFPNVLQHIQERFFSRKIKTFQSHILLLRQRRHHERDSRRPPKFRPSLVARHPDL